MSPDPSLRRPKYSATFWSGAALVFVSLAGYGADFAALAFERLRWLAPGSADRLSTVTLPLLVGLIGGGWCLIVVDAAICGSLFWGRGTGVTERSRNPFGFWLGLAFQAAIALILVALGIALGLGSR